MAKKVRKLHVTVKPVRLEGLPSIPGDHETAAKNLSTMVEVKWKGTVSGFGLGLVPFYRSNRPVNHTSSKPIALGVRHVEWEEEFERVCCIVGPWNISFNVFYGETMDAKNKKSLVGKASLDLSALASKLESTVEKKLLVRSKGSVLSKEATLVVNVTFSEVRTEPDDFIQLGQVSVDSAIPTKMSSRRGGVRDFDSSSSPATAPSSGGRSPIVEIGSSSSPDENQSEPGQKAVFNWWKRRRLSFSVTWRREPREDELTKISTAGQEKPAATAETDSSIEANKWVVKDIVSRDGKSKLKSEVYTASIDQRSEQAAGEAACAAVAVVFDQIWDEVEKEVALASSNGETRVYIVSWNDHFFVVKADLDGYCVIDSLGERLFEGCKQAYILKFDDSSLMYEKEVSSEKLVCEGKKCCREYIKRFLAAIPVAELAAKEEKGNVVDVSLLHEKLQIDLHHIMLTSAD
ncbi:PREDICTED: uncharacterized protein LOC104705044 [Camelina sativa]|uniref:Uncharacterized protein LOC104705044 n=1 Tax=Camelina sativa TaxID=90675 RepID=A0ABM1Q7H7_CAMSA|nr:PREDICTED: uncharacterized protein LOC104705044 [Camelina sativa]